MAANIIVLGLICTYLVLYAKCDQNFKCLFFVWNYKLLCFSLWLSLIDYLLDNNLISDNQHGFIKTRSTLTNLLNSLHHWIASLDSKKSTDIIYIDFAKPFDSISHPKLILKLKSYGVRGKLLSWITAWLSDRTQSVKIDHFFSFPKQVLSGILQGTVLGPLLFLIFINDLTDHIQPDAHPTLFADDLKIFSDQLQTSASSASGSLSSSSSLLQSTLNSIVTWSSTWQMTISIPKCSVLSISNSKTCVPSSGGTRAGRARATALAGVCSALVLALALALDCSLNFQIANKPQFLL